MKGLLLLLALVFFCGTAVIITALGVVDKDKPHAFVTVFAFLIAFPFVIAATIGATFAAWINWAWWRDK